MVTTLTDIEICNNALARFGGGTISSFEGTSQLASTCKRIYEGTRDYLLCVHPWKFCKRKRTLALDADITPINEWQNAHALPANALSAPLAVFGNNSLRPNHDYEIYGNYIYSDYDIVKIDYIARPDESEFPPWFVYFLETATAAKLAVPIADQVSKAQDFRLEAFGSPQENGRGGLYREARRMNALTEPPKSIYSAGSQLVSARAV